MKKCKEERGGVASSMHKVKKVSHNNECIVLSRDEISCFNFPKKQNTDDINYTE